MIRLDTGQLGGLGMLDKHLVFAMVGHEVFRLDQIEHELLLFLRCVSGCMERGQRGVGDNVGADSCQLVDDTADRNAVARNRAG